MRNIRSILGLLVFALAACNGSSIATTPVSAPTPNPLPITKATVAFYVDYTGPQRNSILAVAAGGFLMSATQSFVLNGKMAGPIVDGNTNFYVWGFNRGAATMAPFPDEPNVKFDSVLAVTVTPTGAASGTINLMNGATPASVPVTLTAPDTLSVTFPVAMLPQTGTTPPSGYVWNLWPRNGLGGAPAAQIASFIPENAMAPFSPL
jgi:peptidoglycan/LPS O-acetylase OafA/YrhL